MPSAQKVSWGIYRTPRGVLIGLPSPVENRNVGDLVFVYGTFGEYYSEGEALDEYERYNKDLVKTSWH